MKDSVHLNAGQLARYQAQSMDTTELLAVDRHLAECEACRELLYRHIDAGAKLDGLRASLSQHLAYDQVVTCAEGRGDEALRAHLEECPQCQAEVDDLRQFRELMADPGSPAELVEMPRRPRRVIPAWTAAAALLVGAGLVWWQGQRVEHTAPAVVAQHPAQPAEPAMTPEQNQAVQLALSEHKLERAAVLDRLITRQGVLLGETESGSFDLVGPLGTAAISDRPVFRWRAVRGATKYVVSVFDENFRKVMESPAVSTAEWQPSKPLPRGRIYVWQVNATVGTEIVRSPVPPAPEARFQVIGADAAGAIEQARRDHPANHVLLAALMAKYGVLDEASAELDALAATDPATADALRQSLKVIRAR